MGPGSRESTAAHPVGASWLAEPGMDFAICRVQPEKLPVSKPPFSIVAAIPVALTAMHNQHVFQITLFIHWVFPRRDFNRSSCKTLINFA
jgi:hypothetical protein